MKTLRTITNGMPVLNYFLFTLIFLISCSNSEQLPAYDMSLSQWRLISIESNSKLSLPTFEENLQESAYILIFLNDSIFQLNTNVNLARGNHAIISNNVIAISNYHEFTEVGAAKPQEREFNKKLIELFPKTTTYNMVDKKLIIIGSDIKFIFEKI